jgi:hypothetical protein
MRKIVLLIVVFVLISFQVQAKTIVVGAHGGKQMYSLLAGNGAWYNPVSKWSGKISEHLGLWSNRNNWGSHGVDAAIIYLKENSSSSLETRVADRFSGTWRTTHYITSHYNDGDKVVLIGYSAGANHMLAVASYLKLFGYPVDILALIDPVVGIFHIPSNVKKVALYYQTEGTPMQHGFHNFIIMNSSKTSYYSGHPKLVTNITVDFPARTAHLSLPYESSVWQDLGQKMVALNSSTPFYDRWWSQAFGMNICQSAANYWWSGFANNLATQYDCSSAGNVYGTLVVNDQTSAIDFAPGVQDGFVYSSLGGNSNTTPQGTGHGYNNDQGENEWAGYAHHVGLEYVKVGSKSSGHWYGDKIWPISSIPNHKDFRVKLKRKGGVD